MIHFKTTSKSTPHHEYVDLGLSVKWATCNVGASKPEEYGNYYAWGETYVKSKYDWYSYKWYNSGSISKYNSSSSYGRIDSKYQLESNDDPCYTIWGHNWRMPTRKEFEELINNCNCKWTSLNGVNGMRFTSRINGNSIFLPASGYNAEGHIQDKGINCYYWTSTLYVNNPENAYYFDGYYDNDKKMNTTEVYYYSRCCGQNVRPVQD